MQTLIDIGIVLVAYIFGSIPFGLLIVKLKTGKDIREIESGRTGGTNAMRAAGFWAGLATAVLDILKGAASVWAAQAIRPDVHWLHVAAPIAAILGHNYSIFLIERDENGKFVRLRGGAGGATAVGGALGLWPPSC
jgi:glycerol-3-phosphate acyltransferase PlsY